MYQSTRHVGVGSRGHVQQVVQVRSEQARCRARRSVPSRGVGTAVAGHFNRCVNLGDGKRSRCSAVSIGVARIVAGKMRRGCVAARIHWSAAAAWGVGDSQGAVAADVYAAHAGDRSRGPVRVSVVGDRARREAHRHSRRRRGGGDDVVHCAARSSTIVGVAEGPGIGRVIAHGGMRRAGKVQASADVLATDACGRARRGVWAAIKGHVVWRDRNNRVQVGLVDHQSTSGGDAGVIGISDSCHDRIAACVSRRGAQAIVGNRHGKAARSGIHANRLRLGVVILTELCKRNRGSGLLHRQGKALRGVRRDAVLGSDSDRIGPDRAQSRSSSDYARRRIQGHSAWQRAGLGERRRRKSRRRHRECPRRTHCECCVIRAGDGWGLGHVDRHVSALAVVRSFRSARVGGGVRFDVAGIGPSHGP